MDVALPDSCKSEFSKQLRGGGFRDVAKSLLAIDAEKASATFKLDEDRIKNLVRQTVGFDAVNEAVKSSLVNWLALTFEDCLKSGSYSEVTTMLFKIIKAAAAGDADMQSTRSFASLTFGAASSLA